MRVWAPKATTLDLVLPRDESWEGAECKPMTTRDRQWFVTEDLAPGTLYGFSINGGDPRPDPRSAAQPFGVHGPSRVFDPTEYEWQTDWRGIDTLGSVMYEMHVGTFTAEGTLDAAIDKLPYLAELGIGVVELLPIAPFPGTRGWGYDGVSFTAVHEAYGGPAALQRFVDAAHGAGLGVCLDVVFNHLGPDGNYLNEFGPYFTEKHHTPWGSAINLDDDEADGVRQHIVEAGLRWFTDFRVDSLRLDAVHAMIDESGRHVLADLADAVHAEAEKVGRPFRLIAESDLNDPIVITPTNEGGWGMDGQWADDVHHAIRTRFTGQTHGYYGDFAEPGALSKVFTDVFYHDGTASSFRGQEWGKPVPDSISGHAFIVYDQNHDQVGNRAEGDRPSEFLSQAEQLAMLTLVLLSPFTPMLFQGEEWGSTGRFQFFTDHNDELGPKVSQGRIKEFTSHGWNDENGKELAVPDPQDRSTFDRSTLDWSERDRNDDYLQVVRDLIEIRRHPDFASGDRSATKLSITGDVYTLVRGGSQVIINLGDGTVELPGEPAYTWGRVDGSVAAPESIAIIHTA